MMDTLTPHYLFLVLVVCIPSSPWCLTEVELTPPLTLGGLHPEFTLPHRGGLPGLPGPFAGSGALGLGPPAGQGWRR